ncbi:MAG: type II secretion system protein GspC [Gammaproteobacteria bacterium]|nr:type II secretion system protein GspC [Gammaproteobacteria bacterium]
MTSIALQLPAILQRNSVLLPRMLSYLLVILIAMSSAKLVWSFFSGAESSTNVTEIKAAPPKLVKPPPPKPDYGSQIARLHLMGKASIADNPVMADQNAPDTSLNLTLSGVLALGGGEGFAIIENESKKHKFYQLDEEITSGVTLHSVFSDYVLLARSGRTEKLSLPKASEKGFSNLNNTSTTRKIPISSRVPSQAKANQQPSLSNLKQQLTKNPSSLAKYISISSANDDETGEFMGYKVKPNGGSSALFDELGLVEGDVITTINEISLDNPNKATQAFQKLVSASQLEMTVLRSGTTINLVHNLD